MIALVFLAAACSDTQVEPILEIDSVEVKIDDTCPAEVTFVIKAGKGACDEPLPAIIEWGAGVVEVELLVRSTAEVCIAIVEPYQVAVTLDQPLEPGDYQVVVPAVVNQGTAEFRIDPCR